MTPERPGLRQRQVRQNRGPWRWGLPLLGLVLLALWAAPSRALPQKAEAWQVRLHPPGPWYVGDVLSWEVTPPARAVQPGLRLRLRIDPPHGPTATATVAPRGFDHRPTAVFRWVWDTAQAAAGPHTFLLQEEREGTQPRTVYQGTLYLWPAARRPLGERNLAWAAATTACCRIFYFRGTETERDLPQLRAMTQDVYAEMQARMGLNPDGPLSVVFSPRWWGQGGFTWEDAWVSYRDRAPIPGQTRQVLRHETVHWMTLQAAPGRWIPPLLGEGMAVYLTQGHYRPGEDLYQRVRALLTTRRYIPLPTLARNFYQHQHETAYIEAGALVQYLVERWGWEAFWRFVTSLEPPRSGEDAAQALDRNLARQGTSLQALDRSLRAKALALPPDPRTVDDVTVMLALFETLRTYQRLLDPAAYYRTMWFLNRAQMQARGLVLDAVRSPNTGVHAAIELLLQQSARAWQAGDFDRAWRFLQPTRAVLNQVAVQGRVHDWPQEAGWVRRWVAWARGCGGDIQQLDLAAATAWVRPMDRPPALEPWPLPDPASASWPCPQSLPAAR